MYWEKYALRQIEEEYKKKPRKQIESEFNGRKDK